MQRSTNESGAVAIMTALFLVIVVGVAALAVDLGMQRVGKRDMQALSDVVALDMARQLDGSTAVVLTSSSSWASKFSESRARNTSSIGSSPVVTLEVGTLDAATRAFTVVPNGSATVPNAVRVTASTSISFAFHPGTGGVIASSIASSVKSACYSVGSYAARFRTSDSALLNALKGGMDDFLHLPNGSVDVVSYQGLANASVSLQEIAANTAAGTTSSLLSNSISVGNLIQAMVTALGRQSPPNMVAISALNKVLTGQATMSTPVLMRDFIEMSPNDSAALATKFSVLDIVTGAILTSDGNHFVNIPNLQAQVPGVGNPRAESSLIIIENPHQVCGVVGGPETATTAQVNGHIFFDFSVSSINQVPGISGVVQTPKANVDVTVALAHATGRLTLPEPTCKAGTALDPDTENVQVTTALSTFSAASTLHFSAKITVPLTIGLLTVPTQLDVTFDQEATASLPLPAASSTAPLRVPPNDTTPYSTGSSAVLGHFTISSVATNVNVSTTVAGLSLSELNTAATAALNVAGGPAADLAVNASLTTPLNQLVDNVNALMTPIRSLLGLQVAGADVLAIGRPTCNGAALRG